MNRRQFWVLNLASAILVLLLAAHFVLATHNGRLNDDLNRTRAYINNANQVSAVLDRMAQRIALGSENDPRLRDLLIKYGLTVTLDVQGKRRLTREHEKPNRPGPGDLFAVLARLQRLRRRDLPPGRLCD